MQACFCHHSRRPTPGAQTAVERGVAVKVTPKALSRAVWEFVVFDTHAEDLKDDLQKTAKLVG